MSCTVPARLEQLNGRFATYSTSGARPGFVDPQTRRLFVWPSSLSSSMKSLVTVRLVDAGTAQADGGPNAYVEALPVTGEVITGVVTASTFDPATGRAYGLVFNGNPFRYEVQSFGFGDGGVHFTRHVSTGTPDASGPMMQDLAVLGNQLGATRGNSLVPITLSGTQAQWGTPLPGDPYAQSELYDPANHRHLGVGAYVVTGPGTFRWEPRRTATP